MVDLINNQTKIEFTKKMDKYIKIAVKSTLRHQKEKKMNVSILITDDEFIQGLNKQYRQKDSATDVLSFPLYDENKEYDSNELGDIVISAEQALRQAREFGHPIEQELAFLTVHSMLHLLGYDHVGDETKMFEIQKEIMQTIIGLSGMKSKSIFQSFKFAAEGLWHCIKNERNFRFHLFAAATIFLVLPYYNFSPVEISAVVIIIAIVMICEIFNTAVEIIIDLKVKEFNQLAKAVKDVSAGGVLLGAVCAFLCGLFLFLKIDIIHNIIKDILSSPVKTIFSIIYLAAGYYFVKHFSAGRGKNKN